MWMVFRRLGCLEYFVGLVRVLYEGMFGRVFYDNRLIEEFFYYFGFEVGLRFRFYIFFFVFSRYVLCYFV